MAAGDVIISVEHLSKSYFVGHKTGRGHYDSLREAASRYIADLTRKAIDMGRGREIVEGDEIEEFWALNDVSFDVARGEVIGIIGRNGAGKSTLLKILSRITEPTKGRVTLRGRVASLLEVGTGFHPELSGRENIYLNGAILGMARREIDARFDEIVTFAGVEKFLDTPVKRYSSGMYVRLAFSVAAHLEPDILVIDEVLAVGDVQFQEKCLGKMQDVSRADGRTVLFVSHNMGAVLRLCQRCIVLNRGSVESSGSAEAVVDRYLRSSSDVQHVASSSSGIGKDVYFRRVETIGSNKAPAGTFSHSSEIRLRITIGINKFEAFQNIGVCLLTREKSRVFTVNRLLGNFTGGHESELELEFIIPGGLIAPMNYSFLVALNAHNGGVTYELLDDICPIRVYDDGTDHAFAEGFNYGSIILKDEWEVKSRRIRPAEELGGHSPLTTPLSGNQT